MARPSTFTEAVAEEICIRIMCGDSLAAICRDDDGMPAYRTVMKWLQDDAAFQRNYASAREAQGDADADEIRDIAARMLKGEIEPAAGRAAIDALKWTAGKRKPKVYGDKVALVGGGKGDSPIQFANMTEAEIDARLTAIVGGSEPAPEGAEG